MKTKYHHRPTTEELEVFDELEKMAQHAEKHDKSFSMSGQTKTVNEIAAKNPLNKGTKKMRYQDQMNELIDAEVKATGKARHICVQAVCCKNPDLRAAAVKEYNADLQNNQRVVDTAQRHSNRSYGSR